MSLFFFPQSWRQIPPADHVASKSQQQQFVGRLRVFSLAAVMNKNWIDRVVLISHLTLCFGVFEIHFEVTRPVRWPSSGHTRNRKAVGAPAANIWLNKLILVQPKSQAPSPEESHVSQWEQRAPHTFTHAWLTTRQISEQDVYLSLNISNERSTSTFSDVQGDTRLTV